MSLNRDMELNKEKLDSERGFQAEGYHGLLPGRSLNLEITHFESVKLRS